MKQHQQPSNKQLAEKDQKSTTDAQRLYHLVFTGRITLKEYLDMLKRKEA